MQYLIYLSAVLIVITKLADVLSTLRFLKNGNIGMERNGFVRKQMHRFGAKTVVWAVFLITVIIVAIVLWAVLQSGLWWYEWSFVIIAAFISIVQGSVAYYNYTGKKLFIIQHLMKFLR